MKIEVLKQSLLRRIMYFYFDENYYRVANFDVSLSGLEVFDHFRRYGLSELREPNEHSTVIQAKVLSYYLKLNFSLVLFIINLFKIRIPINLNFLFDPHILESESKFSIKLRINFINNIIKSYFRTKSRPIFLYVDTLPLIESEGRGIPRSIEIIEEITKLLKASDISLIYVYNSDIPSFKPEILTLGSTKIYTLNGINKFIFNSLLKMLNDSICKIWLCKIDNINNLYLNNSKEILSNDHTQLVMDFEALTHEVGTNSRYNEYKFFDEHNSIINQILNDITKILPNENISFCTVSNHDKQILANYGVDHNLIHVLGHKFKLNNLKNNYGHASKLLFLGNFHDISSPNFFMLEEFIDNSIFEKIISKYPVKVIGKLNSVLLDKLKKFDKIEIIGQIDSFDNVLEDVKIHLVLPPVSQGILHKIHTTNYFSIPPLVTSVIAKQNDLVDNQNCIILNESDSVLKIIDELYTNEKLWEKISSNIYNTYKKRATISYLDQINSIIKL